MTQYQGVVFDLDGTLLDTLADLADSVDTVLREYGYPTHDRGWYRSVIGRGFRDLLTRSLPGGRASDAEVAEAVEKFTAVYDRKYEDETRPYDGIPELLRELRARGVPLGVNSNKRQKYTAALVSKFFPDIPFVGVYGERDGIARKPDPQAALLLARGMGLPPERVLYAGDSGTDMRTGKNAGMGAGGVLWGFREIEELRSDGADYIFAAPGDILPLFTL